MSGEELRALLEMLVSSDQTERAAYFGLKRNSLSQYESGSRPVPPLLAGWARELERRVAAERRRRKPASRSPQVRGSSG